MKKIIISNKTKVIIYSIIFVFIFSLGAFARPGIDLTATLASSVFSSKPSYVAPPSEYEAQVETLWHSDKHQAVCKANAAAAIALQLAHKYVGEAEKQAVLSAYDLPITEAVEKTKSYGKR